MLILHSHSIRGLIVFGLTALAGCGAKPLPMDPQGELRFSQRDVRSIHISDSIPIPIRYLDLKKLTFARVSTVASDKDYPAPAHEVALKIEGDYLLLNDFNPSHVEIARWKITGKEKNYVLVDPSSDSSEPRYFHDVRSTADGLCFHETAPSQKTDSLHLNPIGPGKTWTIFLLATTGTPEFASQSPVKEIGFMVNYHDSLNPQIYNGQEPFNPDHLVITKWHNRRTIEWVISRSIPMKYIPFIKDGISAWNKILPPGLSFSMRFAASGEELDGPFTNAIVYQPTMTHSNAATSFTFYPSSGEIFRATLVIGKLPDNVTEHGPKLRGTISHEVGHVLGLRHNFKGSLYDHDLANYPTGSSIMEYSDTSLDSQRKIGPYDRDAVRWAYADNSITTKYPFCTDELNGVDPLCQQNDPTSSSPFLILIGRVQDLLAKQIYQSQDLVNFTPGKSPFDRIGPYVRRPRTPFYSAENNTKINALFEIFLEKVSMKPRPVGAQIAALHLQRIVDIAKDLGLSEGELKVLLPALGNFNAWKEMQRSER